MKIRAETEVMHLQAKELQRLPANNLKLGERPGTDCLSWSLEGTNPSNNHDLRLWPPELRGNAFLLLKHPVCGTLFQKPWQMNTVCYQPMLKGGS